MQSEKMHFILLSAATGLLVQVLNAVHAMGKADCIAIVPKGTRRVALTSMTTQCMYADLNGADDHYLIAEINRLAAERPGLTVIPCDCPAERAIDRIAQWLNAKVIPAPDATMLDCFDDKWAFHQFCEKHGVSVPSTRQVASKHDLGDFAGIVREYGLPFVIKPPNLAGSIGVEIISSEQEFRTIVDDNDYQFSPLLIQQYVKGVDICLNLLAIHGRMTAISIQQRDMPQNFSDPIEFVDNDYLESAARKLSESSCYHGVMHIDARIEEQTGRVYIFESNPRFWGSLTASAWCGLNFVQQCLDPAPPGQIRRLQSGRANLQYHPIVTPALWGQALFSPHAHQRRMARLMKFDLWTFLVQLGTFRQKVGKSVNALMNAFQLRFELRSSPKNVGRKVPPQ